MNIKNESGKNVDWWFIYKTPSDVGMESNDGGKYLYYDPDGKKLALSDNSLDKKEGALYHTLNEIFDSDDPNQGFIVYNDENPESNNEYLSKGHCKGILCFNKKKNTGILLLHSVPRFPFKGELDLPEKELKYGQTFLGITLSGYEVAEQLANQMLHQQGPKVYETDSKLPKSIDKTEALYQLYNDLNIHAEAKPSTVKFKSKGGKDFRLIAKSKAWKKDFWIDLVSPSLGVDMDTESWRRGPLTPSTDSGVREEVEDVMKIDLAPLGLKGYNWKYTKDHSKWGVTTKNDAKKGKWVCIADINRMVTQEKRGGGGICFIEPGLWEALLSIAPLLQEEK